MSFLRISRIRENCSDLNLDRGLYIRAFISQILDLISIKQF